MRGFQNGVFLPSPALSSNCVWRRGGCVTDEWPRSPLTAKNPEVAWIPKRLRVQRGLRIKSPSVCIC
jgi:hypothetical protein